MNIERSANLRYFKYFSVVFVDPNHGQRRRRLLNRSGMKDTGLRGKYQSTLSSHQYQKYMIFQLF